jgi:hypothetical protein
MTSDLASISRGDAMPVPESVLPPEVDKEPVFKPETQFGGDVSGFSPAPKKSKALLWIAMGVLVVAAGGAGYFFVYPTLFSGESGVMPPPVAFTPPPAPVVSHQSLFTQPVAGSTEVRLPNTTHDAIMSSLGTIALAKLVDGSVQEVAMLDANGSQVPWKSYAPAFIPTLTSDDLGAWFEDDFTAFLYYDAQGAWPGYVARVKNGVNLTDAATKLKAMESSPSSFYLASPGAFGAFKDGKLGTVATRYAVGSTPGASFNYIFTGSYLIVSTSFNGLKTSVPLVGL